MALRQPDFVSIESVLEGDLSIVLDRTTQYEIGLSCRQPSVARFEVGDERTWGVFEEVMGIGSKFSVSVNGVPRVTGRLLTRNMPLSPDSGATVQLMVRTVLADAAFTCCTLGIDVTDVTLDTLILKAFERLGVTRDDFIFKADLARDALTGRRSGQPSAAASLRARIARLESQQFPANDEAAKHVIGQKRVLQEQLSGAETRPVVPDLEEIQVAQAKVQAGETIYGFVERHLLRHGLMMWDAPDGKIVIGHPDDSQDPLYIMSAQSGPESVANNILSCTRTEDYEQVPASIWVYGKKLSDKKGYAAKGAIKANERDPLLGSLDPGLDRLLIVLDEGITTQELAAARARRELLNRSMSKDAWSIETDGLSYWTGSKSVEYGIDTVADVRVDIAGRRDGPYLIHELVMRGDADGSHTTTMTGIGRGIWVL